MIVIFWLFGSFSREERLALEIFPLTFLRNNLRNLVHNKAANSTIMNKKYGISLKKELIYWKTSLERRSMRVMITLR